MINPLNRTTAPQVLRLFDACFKHGVLDAKEVNDDFEVRQFITSHCDNWTFGVLGEDLEIDWYGFRFTLYKWCRYAGLTKFAENYLLRIKAKNYLWCILPYCMRFYIMGMKEWLEYPNPAMIEVFKSERKVHWDLEHNLRKFTKMDYVSYMHDFANEYRKLPENERPVTDTSMDGFISAIFDLTRKYAKR